MSTKIEWCMNPDGTLGEVWNPVTGCTKVSQGCKNCYAERIYERFHPGQKFSDVHIIPGRLDIPLRWKRPRRVFVNSMSDLFHEDVPELFIYEIFAVMASTWKHNYIILTKRPNKMLDFCSRIRYIKTEELKHLTAPSCSLSPYSINDPVPLPNVWLGVSVEDQETADERIPLLLQTPAAKRIVSCEPLLGPVDLAEWISLWGCGCDGSGTIDWVIVGGESGPGARPMRLEWAESLVTQCQNVGIPVFVKQLGGFPDKRNRIEEWPENLRVREWPEG